MHPYINYATLHTKSWAKKLFHDYWLIPNDAPNTAHDKNNRLISFIM